MELADTKLCTLYYHELWWFACSIVKKCEKLFDETKVPESGYMLQVNPDLHSVIASILSDAANAKRLFVTQDGKLKDENGERHRLRKARAKELSGFLEPLKLKEILNHKVRNTLEHFDEYLDESNYELSKKPIGQGRAAYNIIISHWEVTNPRLYPIRLYVSSERKFYNMKWSVDIGVLYTEAKAIIKKLSELRAFKEGEQGGLMVRI